MSRAILPASVLLPLVLFVRGQSGNDRDYRLTANSELVLLDVSVRESKGGYISTLKQENFRVYENGKLQTITQFSSEDTPITVGLVIDDSRSMRSKRNEVNTAAISFIDKSNPKDEVFVTHFNDHVRHGLPAGTIFSDDPEALRLALWTDRSEGMTSLNDAIIDALHQLELGKQDKKSLLIISDGGDNASTHGFAQVVDAVRATRAILYTIALFDPEDPQHNLGLLHRLAEISGGISYVPKELSQLHGICTGIAEDMRNRYEIGYVPVRVDDKSAMRSVRVSVVGAGDHKFVVHARTSYLLPERP